MAIPVIEFQVQGYKISSTFQVQMCSKCFQNWVLATLQKLEHFYFNIWIWNIYIKNITGTGFFTKSAIFLVLFIYVVSKSFFVRQGLKFCRLTSIQLEIYFKESSSLSDKSLLDFKLLNMKLHNRYYHASRFHHGAN